MTEISPVPNSIFQSTPTTKKRVSLIIALVVLGIGVLIAFFGFHEASQSSRIIYAEKPPTAESQLAYGTSGTFEPEAFSGKTLNAYKIPYTSKEIENFDLIGFLGILIIFLALCFFAYKYDKIKEVKGLNKQLETNKNMDNNIPTPPQIHSKMKVKVLGIIAFIIIVVVLSRGINFLRQYELVNSFTNWTTYRNEEYGFELKHPNKQSWSPRFSDRDHRSATNFFPIDIPYMGGNNDWQLDLAQIERQGCDCASEYLLGFKPENREEILKNLKASNYIEQIQEKDINSYPTILYKDNSNTKGSYALIFGNKYTVMLVSRSQSPTFNLILSTFRFTK